MLRARFFDGRTSRERQVVLRREGDVLRLDGEDVLRAVPLREVEVGEATGNGGRMLVLPDGGRCELDTGPELESFLAVIEHRDRRVARWQGRWSIVVGSLLVGGVVLVAAYRVGLPWLAERLARTVPERWVQLLGTHTLATLDHTVFEPSRLGHERLEHLRTLVAGLKDPSGGLPQHVLELRECPALGANAFALPGGDVVVTDALVEIASDDELLGALAHELGHLHERHALRQLIQSSAVATVAAYWFGDVSGLAAGVSASLLQAKYSRDFEIEADAYAARVLRASGHSTRGLAKLLARLERLSGSANGAPDAAAYLSSHPPTAERIRRLRAS
jgi:Zn-dependent protease with chaperone function